MENNTEKRVVEIDGIKMEVDMRTAKVVDTFRVGSAVKLLKKEYNGYKSCPGTIVGFDEFKNLPTVIIAYVEASFSGAEIKFEYLNSESQDVEMVAMDSNDLMPTRDTIISKLDQGIAAKQAELDKLVNQRDYFFAQFGKAFPEYAETAE